MTWAYLFGLGLLLWGTCGAVMAVGRRLWSLNTALYVHLIAAPATAFFVSSIHKLIDL